jgi:Ran GTPase-activating protein (RanGAP) involved in mRNA processing and transport
MDDDDDDASPSKRGAITSTRLTEYLAENEDAEEALAPCFSFLDTDSKDLEIKVTATTAAPIGKYLASVEGIESLAIVDSTFDKAHTAKALCTRTLTALALNRCEIAPEAFAEFVPLAREAKLLDLAYCALNKRLGDVAPFLRSCACLTSLSLQVNDLGDEGCQKVAEALADVKTVELLDLRWNNIGEKGAESISKLARKLKTVNLSGNAVKSGGARHLLRAMHSETLMSVDMSMNHIANEVLADLIALAGARTTYAEVNLEWNVVSDDDKVEALADALGAESSHLRVQLGNNEVAADADTIADKSRGALNI